MILPSGWSASDSVWVSGETPPVLGCVNAGWPLLNAASALPLAFNRITKSWRFTELVDPASPATTIFPSG